MRVKRVGLSLHMLSQPSIRHACMSTHNYHNMHKQRHTCNTHHEHTSTLAISLHAKQNSEIPMHAHKQVHKHNSCLCTHDYEHYHSMHSMHSETYCCHQTIKSEGCGREAVMTQDLNTCRTEMRGKKSKPHLLCFPLLLPWSLPFTRQ